MLTTPHLKPNIKFFKYLMLFDIMYLVGRGVYFNIIFSCSVLGRADIIIVPVS